jgi:hypothetical protein
MCKADFCYQAGAPFPCIRINNELPTPIDFGFSLPWSDTYLPHYIYKEFLFYNLHQMRIEEIFIGKSRTEPIHAYPEEVREFFKSKIINFLSIRFNAISLFNSGNTGSDTSSTSTPPSTMPPPTLPPQAD